MSPEPPWSLSIVEAVKFALLQLFGGKRDEEGEL
jgi:hypothetical protein